jgi:hypothetical protein
MVVEWMFDGGLLEARNKNGSLLGRWKVDASEGPLLANLLNHNPALGRVFLSGSGQHSFIRNA